MEWNGLEPFSTKNTKNGFEQNMDGTIGERTNEKLSIQRKVLILEQSRTISKKPERAQPYFTLINDKLKRETFCESKINENLYYLNFLMYTIFPPQYMIKCMSAKLSLY